MALCQLTVPCADGLLFASRCVHFLLLVMKSQLPGSSSLSPPENLVSSPFGPSPTAVTAEATACQSTWSPGPSVWLPSPAAKQLPPRESGGPQLVPAKAVPPPIPNA